MNVLLVNTNREKSPQTLVPLGVCCVASAAESAEHETHVLDLCFERDPVSALKQAAQRIKPDVVGFSIRNLDNCDFTKPLSYLPEVRELIDVCRESCGAEIVIGGPAVSQAPEALCRYLDCRYAVVGEGEEAFPRLLQALETCQDSSQIPGVTLHDGITTSTTPLPAADLLHLSDPNPSRWLDLRHYARYDASMPVQTKRGCGFRCSYCVYPLIEGREWRLREPEWVAEQVRCAKVSDLRMVEFVDSVFGAPAKHAVECCEAITRASTAFPLSTMDFNPGACSPELISAMNAAGFEAVGISAESGSDDMLNSLGKNFDSQQLRMAASNLQKLNARRLWVFMIGAPGENERSVRETARFIGELPQSDLVLVTHGIRVLPDTALYKRLVADGEVDPENELIEPVFYYSPEITPDRAEQILRESGFPESNMVTLSDGGHRYAPLVQRIVSVLGIRPPYWRYLPLINGVRRVLRV